MVWRGIELMDIHIGLKALDEKYARNGLQECKSQNAPRSKGLRNDCLLETLTDNYLAGI